MNMFAWGKWVDSRIGNRFAYVFRESYPVDGWIEATGLYRAQDGDTLTDLDAIEADVKARTRIITKDTNPIRINANIAGVLALAAELSTAIGVEIEGAIAAG